jgi:CRP-like cAMP-binding protein
MNEPTPILPAYLSHFLLMPGIPQRRQTFKKGETIFEKGKDATSLYVVMRGKVALTHAHGNKRRLAAMIDRYGVFGWESVSGYGVYITHAVAVEDTILLMARGCGVINHAGSAGLLMREMAMEIVEGIRTATMVGLGDTKERLDYAAKLYPEIAHRKTGEHDMIWSDRRIAELTCLARETVTLANVRVK